MSEENKRNVTIERIYVKDASLEVPGAPEIFQAQGQSNMDMQVNTRSRDINNDVHEVTLQISLTAKLQDEVVFMVELEQVGLFKLQGFSKDELLQVLGIYCPNNLFPYAREAISGLVGKGGFPPVLLAPVNFEALFAKHQQELQQAQSESTAQAKH